MRPIKDPLADGVHPFWQWGKVVTGSSYNAAMNLQQVSWRTCLDDILSIRDQGLRIILIEVKDETR